MQWDVSVGQATFLTLLIGVLVGTLATLLALLVSLGTFCFRIAGRHLAVGLVSSFLLVPVYVQATAWSAGFGSNGWLRLSQVDAAKSPWMGVASVVWIHSCAALPYCFWIISLGLRRIHDAGVDQALVEFGPWFSLRRQILPRLGTWLLGAFLWAFASVQYDMVVTNLFQTPTLCESVYQQVQFGKLRSVPILIAWVISMVCGLALALSVFLSMLHEASQAGRSPSDPSGSERLEASIARPWHVWLTLTIWGVLAVCCMLPWMNLISRMGWSSLVVEGRGVRSWSLNESFDAIGHVADFREEFGWSLQLSLWATGLSLFLTAVMIQWSSNRYRSAWMFGIIGCMLATPGPLINLTVGQLLNRWLPGSWSFLSDRTLLGPILALQFRVLPVVFGLVWVTRQAYLKRYGELLALEAGLPHRMRVYSSMRFCQWGWILAFWIGFSIAFGDLASYLLVQPPGVTTIAMRMFDLLHYGTKNREAGLAVVLAFFGTLSSLAWLRLPRSRPDQVAVGSGRHELAVAGQIRFAPCGILQARDPLRKPTPINETPNMAKSKSTDQDESSLSFEGAMASLEQVVRKLESGSLPLEQMLSEYAKAVEYVQVCHRQLEGARRRIAQLQSVDADGTAVTKAWDDTEPSVQENRDAPSRRKTSS